MLIFLDNRRLRDIIGNLDGFEQAFDRLREKLGFRAKLEEMDKVFYLRDTLFRKMVLWREA